MPFGRPNYEYLDGLSIRHSKVQVSIQLLNSKAYKRSDSTVIGPIRVILSTSLESLQEVQNKLNAGCSQKS
jgi:hypothetical protein